MENMKTVTLRQQIDTGNKWGNEKYKYATFPIHKVDAIFVNPNDTDNTDIMINGTIITVTHSHQEVKSLVFPDAIEVSAKQFSHVLYLAFSLDDQFVKEYSWYVRSGVLELFENQKIIYGLTEGIQQPDIIIKKSMIESKKINSDKTWVSIEIPIEANQDEIKTPWVNPVNITYSPRFMPVANTVEINSIVNVICKKIELEQYVSKAYRGY